MADFADHELGKVILIEREFWEKTDEALISPSIQEHTWGQSKESVMKYIFSFSVFQGGSIQNTKSKRCLELVENNDNEFGFQLTLQKCTGQNWTITNLLPGSNL